MHKLFVVDGAFGTGKKQLVNYIRSQSIRKATATVLQKISTRNHNHGINTRISCDLTEVTDEAFDAHVMSAETDRFYYYEYTHQRYGFFKRDLDNALGKYENVFVIVRDKRTIEQLKEEYSSLHVIPVYIYTDPELLVNGLRENGVLEKDIQYHVERQRRAWQDYLLDPRFYQVVTHRADERKFNEEIDKLIYQNSEVPTNELWISYKEKFPLIEPLVGRKQTMLKKLEMYPYEDNVFLMMRFRQSNKHLADFIKDNIEKNGLRCVRADYSEWKITDDVYNAIAVLYCCKYGIALFDELKVTEDQSDVNQYNPNVAYELGMMHLQKKECLILRHSALAGVPFDLVAKVRQDYSDVLQLQNIITEWISQIGK